MKVSGLRSPHDTIHGLVYFGRMLDKIRLEAAGTLPEEYRGNLGLGFDERCCHFLQVEYTALVAEVKKGGSDEALLEWAWQHGAKPSEEQVEIWNQFMVKRGWRDPGHAMLVKRKREGGFEAREEVQTMFDYIDLDEERELRAWG